MFDTSQALFFLLLGPWIVGWQSISKIVASQVKKKKIKNLPGLEMLQMHLEPFFGHPWVLRWCGGTP